jgi:carbon-monoxide dehydrogenase iron sulfur subunit
VPHRSERIERDMDYGFVRVHFRKRRTVSADSKTCAGCRTCEVVCSLIHEGRIDLIRSRIFIKSNPFKGAFVPLICHQCSDAPCFYACTESAIEIEETYGTVLINKGKCTGCRARKLVHSK